MMSPNEVRPSPLPEAAARETHPHWLRRAAAGALVLGLGCAGLSAAGTFLVVPAHIRQADVIVVLGGDGPPRAAEAAALFQAGLAPRVLVSGDGDCRDIRDAMIARAVPRDAILLECASGSTYENAAFSGPLLAGLHARDAMLVTSWFHLRRALACMSHAAPWVRWIAAPAPPPPSQFGMLEYAVPIMKEYVKLNWYALHYGIVPYPATF